MSHIDLECGSRSRSVANSEEEEEEGSVCFSVADEGSCNSQFYSTGNGDCSYDNYSSFASGSEVMEDEALGSIKSSSSLPDPSVSVDLESGGIGEDRGDLEKSLDRDCRICHLSLVSSSPGSGIPIELGCSCKDDLAAAHKHCADAWFKIKGNKTCEICNSIARNVVFPNDIKASQQASEGNAATAVTSMTVAAVPSGETRTCLNGHRFLNFVLACMVFAFVISWLFHFNIPS